MTNEEPTLLLGETSILTIRHYEEILEALDHGVIEFTENVAWKSASKLLADYKEQGWSLPVILADSTHFQLGVLAWGIAEEIVVTGSSTRVTLSNLTDLPSRPFVSSLLCQSTGENLTEADQRNYRIVDTPDFTCELPKTIILTWNPKIQVPLEDAVKGFQEFKEGGFKLLANI
jgi:hypothetical protein